MKLASLRHGRDGMLVVVARDLSRCVAVPHVAHTLQAMMDGWAHTAPRLARVYDLLNEGPVAGEKPFDTRECAAPPLIRAELANFGHARCGRRHDYNLVQTEA